MWKLSTGTLVERQMKKLASDAVHEHPCHSLTLDPYDPSWAPYFTEEEVQELKSYQVPPIIPLPTAAKKYLEKFNGLKTLDDTSTSPVSLRSTE
ncbi:hypothetical protein BJV82DRAFT_664126 [Fennellomyces sp. T-0311]|nr:hypothetical protein BJV82DRAFT_664126 [Fennellomyces sp. T-0311]